MTDKVTVIIPSYNSAAYLLEALQSLPIELPLIKEVIIVDDGSTDAAAKAQLKALKGSPKLKILEKKNGGPASARNFGISQATSPYIFFLDSDNIATKAYLEEAAEILNQHNAVGVVYGNPVFFGDRVGSFKSQPMDKDLLLHENFIDMCTMVRKEVFDEVGLLDEHPLVLGHEDWELWIRVAQSRWQFYHIDKELFKYRQRKNSLIQQANEGDKRYQFLKYIFIKHSALYFDCFTYYKKKYREYEYDRVRPFRSLIKYLFNK